MPHNKNKHARPEILAQRPQRDRTACCKGLFRTAASPKPAEGEPSQPTFSSPNIDRSGGDMKAGIIRGCSLCMEGEALGHGYWIDSEFIQQLNAAAVASGNAGLKARFTHPSLSGDGLGTFLGRMKGHSVAGQKCVGDLHLSPVAHKSPDGNLAEYVMDLADSDPEAFGMSIVFEHDWEAERAYALANGAEEKVDPEFGPYIDWENFKSTDPANTENLPHARLADVFAADVVDSPAANPEGLFHREQQFAQEADSIADFALGLTDQEPAVASLDALNPSRVKGFVARYLDAHNLKIVPKETAMEEATKPEEKPAETPAETKPEEKPAETKPEEKPAESKPEEKPAEQSAQTPAEEKPLEKGRAECKRFMAAFGSNGVTWFAEGLSFEDAQAKHNELLAKENAALKTQLDAAKSSLGEEKPVSFDANTDGDKNLKDAKDASRFPGLGPRLSRFAAGIKLPVVAKAEN